MQTVSQLYETIKAGLHRVEVRVRIDRENYPSGYWYLQTNTGAAILTDDGENIEVTPFPAANLTEGTLFGVTITGGLYSSQTFAIGSCVSREIEVRFLLGNAEIPRMAMIQPEVRLVNDAGDVSEWIPKGTFWLDTRELDKETGIMTVRGYDAMLKGEAEYIAPGIVGDWPKTMSSVASEIAGLMGLTMDSRNTINSAYMMNLPTGYSMREILGYIAVANCGNWIITDEGKLRLIRVNDTVDNEDLGLSAMTYHIGEPYQAFSKVEINLSENLYVESGDDTGRTLVVDCPIVTTTTGETIAAAVLAALSGFIYTPLTADGAILDPAMEIGDTVTVGTTTSVLATQTMRLDSLCASDISAPGEDELDHEYPYQSVGQRKIERKISNIETTFRVETDAIIGRVEELSESSIASVSVEYALGTSSTTAPTTGWSTSSPQWEEGKYIWQRTVTTYADSTQASPHVSISAPTCIQGANGENGVGISSIVPEYYLSTSASSPTGGSWTTTPPAWQSGKYIWTRSHIYWNDNTNTTTTPVLDNTANGMGQKYTELKQTVDGITLTAVNNGSSQTVESDVGTFEENTIYVPTDDSQSFGFTRTSDDYYTSTNGGVNNSFSYGRFLFNFSEATTVILKCISYGESGYDFGVVSQVDVSLSHTRTEDSSGVLHSFRGESSSQVQEISVVVPSGSHFISFKYVKDSSQSSGGDYFKIRPIVRRTVQNTQSTTLTLTSQGITMTSATIQFNGLVKFSDLSQAGSTVINGANITTGTISADRIDASTIRVKEVWYYDTFNLYRMLRSIVSGVNTYTNVGPEQINNGYAQVLNLYGTQILFKPPGESYSSLIGSDVLSVDNANHVISSDWSWNLGSFTNPWSRVICTRYELWYNSSDYGSLYVDSSGNLEYMDFNGRRYPIAGPSV